MEERVKTSFIPKASLQVERKQAVKSNPVALANIIAGAILVVALVGAGGIFLFERFTLQNIDAKQNSLERSRTAFEPATIRELSRLNTRIETGEILLQNHIALSTLFDELETRMLSSVRLSDFSYDTVGAGKVTLASKGEAASFNAVALQSGNFSKSQIITEPIFSNVNIGQTGSISFDFTALVDTTHMRYAGTPATAETESFPMGFPQENTPPPL